MYGIQCKQTYHISCKLESRFKIEWPGVIDARKLSGESKSFIVRATEISVETECCAFHCGAFDWMSNKPSLAIFTSFSQAVSNIKIFVWAGAQSKIKNRPLCAVFEKILLLMTASF